MSTSLFPESASRFESIFNIPGTAVHCTFTSTRIVPQRSGPFGARSDVKEKPWKRQNLPLNWIMRIRHRKLQRRSRCPIAPTVCQESSPETFASDFTGSEAGIDITRRHSDRKLRTRLSNLRSFHRSMLLDVLEPRGSSPRGVRTRIDRQQ
jgi:hypothetical protein